MLGYHRQTKPGLITLYDIRPGNGAGLFLQACSPHGANEIQQIFSDNSKSCQWILTKFLWGVWDVSLAAFDVSADLDHNSDTGNSLRSFYHCKMGHVIRIFARLVLPWQRSAVCSPFSPGGLSFPPTPSNFTRSYVFKFHWNNKKTIFLLNSAVVSEVYLLQCSLFYRLFRL